MNDAMTSFSLAILFRAMAVSQLAFLLFSIKVAFPTKNLSKSVVFFIVCLTCYLFLFFAPYDQSVGLAVLGLNLLLPLSTLLFMKKLNQDASDGTNLRTDLPIVLSGTALILTYVLTDLKSNHLFKVIIVSWNVFLIGWGAFSLWRGYRDDLNRSRTILRLVLSSTAIAYVIIVGIVSSTKPLERDQHLILLALEGGLLTIVGILLNGALIQPQYLNAMISIDRKAEESPPPLVRQIDELEAMRAKVQQLMDDEKLFLSPRLTLEDLADKVGAPVYRVRYLLNQHLGYENFAGFLNPYRLRYAAALLMDPARNDDKIFAIALESGFGSLAPFNKAFKALYGVTPSEYRQKQVNASAAT